MVTGKEFERGIHTSSNDVGTPSHGLVHVLVLCPRGDVLSPGCVRGSSPRGGRGYGTCGAGSSPGIGCGLAPSTSRVF